MAVTTINIQKITAFNSALTESSLMTAIATSSEGAVVTLGKDERCLLRICTSASTDQTLTVSKGNGIQGVADLSITVPSGGAVVVQLESGKFRQVSGTNKGKVMLVPGADATVLVGAYQLY